MNLPSTEGRSTTAVALDQLDSLQLAAAFQREDQAVVDALGAAQTSIASAIELTETALKAGGRLILGGAGTSGRLAVIEAAECRPTFSSDRVVAVMAGGPGAFLAAREGAEDAADEGAQAVRELKVEPRDFVLGISASGRTPWVWGLLGEARRRHARSGLLCASPVAGPEAEGLDLVIHLPTGPELLSGSTRLKAGTATKCALNAITTGAMARLGKVLDDLMIDVAPTNVKLRARAKRIVSTLAKTSEARAQELLELADWEVKTAILMGRSSLEAGPAREALTLHGGHLRRALGEHS